jgi:hypothetical protein
MADFISKTAFTINDTDFQRILSEMASIVGSEHCVFFLPNKLEGLLEFLSYTGDSDNMTRAQGQFKEAGILLPAGLDKFIYASCGSSSSQIFAPVLLNDNVKNQILLYGGLYVEVQGWTIVLVANNVNCIGDENVYSPLKILELIFDSTDSKYPISISNAISHTVYGKGHTFQKLGGASHTARLSEICEEPYNAEVIKDEIIWETLQKTSRAFRANTIVIPRVSNKNAGKNMNGKNVNGALTEENSKIKNDWSDTIIALDSRPVVDIGGGKTNTGLRTSDAAAIMRAIHKEMADPVSAVAGCTGQIRTTVVSMKDSVKNVELMPFLMLKPEFVGQGAELLSVSGGEYYDKESGAITVFVLKG